MPPHFIEAGLKINTLEYLKILEEEKFTLWIKKNYDITEVMFIHESAPAHLSKLVLIFLKRELPLFVGTLKYFCPLDARFKSWTLLVKGRCPESL